MKTTVAFVTLSLGLSLPSSASEPTFTCADVAKVGKDLYARTKEAHDGNHRRAAEYYAEGFWRVAEGFSACGGDVAILRKAMATIYPSSTRGRLKPESGFGMPVSGVSGDTEFMDLTVQVSGTGAKVVGGKTVPGKMLVEGVPFVPEGTSNTAVLRARETGTTASAAASPAKAAAAKGK